MLKILGKGLDKVIGIQVKGKLTHEDYEKISYYLDGATQEAGSVRLFCELDDLSTIEPKVFWDDLKLGVKHFGDIEKIAIVGDKKWMEWWAALVNPVTPHTDFQHFNTMEQEQAWSWLASQEEK